MQKEDFILINSSILPPVFKKVIYAKELLASGQAHNTSQAVIKAGISRSAFYKYRNNVFSYISENNNIVNLSAVLSDKAGVFSALTTKLYENGANILTVNQGIPVDKTATVSLTVQTDNVKISVDSLIEILKNTSGVISVKKV